MEGKICNKCGKINESDSDFCGTCGTDIRTVRAADVSKPTPKLQKCPDCQKEISALATVCPNCGRPTSAGDEKEKQLKRKRRGNTQGMGCLIMLLALLFILVAPWISAPLFVVGLVILIIGFFV